MVVSYTFMISYQIHRIVLIFITSTFILAGCEPGYEPAANFTFCKRCDIGTYKEVKGFDLCISCPRVPGYYGSLTSTEGATNKDRCYPVSKNKDRCTE